MSKTPKSVGAGLATRDLSPGERAIKKVNLSFPEFGFILVTRAALGAGALLLATGRLDRRSRQRLGTVLLGLGAVTTIPAAFFLFGGKPRRKVAAEAPEKVPGIDG